MARQALTRAAFIPTNAARITDKATGAEAYVYARKDRPCAMLFAPKGIRPVWRYRFKSEADRARHIEDGFAALRARATAVAARMAERKAAPAGLEPGDILRSSWGYEQTNIDYFEVVAIKGKSVTLREIGRATTSTDGNWTGKCVPQPGTYKSEPFRRLAVNGAVKIDTYRRAEKWNTGRVAGVPVGPVDHWTAYA